MIALFAAATPEGQRAIERGREAARSNRVVGPVLIDGTPKRDGPWTVLSYTDPCVCYQVDLSPEGVACSCIAGHLGRWCWHAGAVLVQAGIAQPQPPHPQGANPWRQMQAAPSSQQVNRDSILAFIGGTWFETREGEEELLSAIHTAMREAEPNWPASFRSVAEIARAGSPRANEVAILCARRIVAEREAAKQNFRPVRPAWMDRVEI
jgi:hypothetical protein